jgi:hypothetical protein
VVDEADPLVELFFWTWMTPVSVTGVAPLAFNSSTDASAAS